MKNYLFLIKRSIKRKFYLTWSKFRHDKAKEIILKYNEEVKTPFYILTDLFDKREKLFKKIVKAKEKEDREKHYIISCELVKVLNQITFQNMLLEIILEKYFLASVQYVGKKLRTKILQNGNYIKL